jgi:hypothetical protein
MDAELARARGAAILCGMRTKLRVAALLLALVIAAVWFFGGPNFGWTKTSVPVKRRDPVTELEVDDYVPRFVPGVDFLGAGFAAAAALAGVSFLIRKKTAAQN